MHWFWPHARFWLDAIDEYPSTNHCGQGSSVVIGHMHLVEADHDGFIPPKYNFEMWEEGDPQRGASQTEMHVPQVIIPSRHSGFQEICV